MGTDQLVAFHDALNTGAVDMASFGTVAAFKLGELSATVLLYMAKHGDSVARRTLQRVLMDPTSLPVRVDIMAARCADFQCWDLAATTFHAHAQWLQMLRCRLMLVKQTPKKSNRTSTHSARNTEPTEKGKKGKKGKNDTAETKNDQNERGDMVGWNDAAADAAADGAAAAMLSEFQHVMALASADAQGGLLQYFLNEWAMEPRSNVLLEKALLPLLTTTPDQRCMVPTVIFSLDKGVYEQLQLSCAFCFRLAQIKLQTRDGHGRSPGTGTVPGHGNKDDGVQYADLVGGEEGGHRRGSLKHTQQMWSEIRSNLDHMSITKNAALVMNADVLLSGGGGSGRRMVFTCGHTFDTDDFYNRVLVTFEAQLNRLPVLPLTCAAIVDEYKTVNGIQLPCPKCLFRQLFEEKEGR